MFAVQPKAPEGFKDYLLVSSNYVLAGNQQSRLAVPMVSERSDQLLLTSADNPLWSNTNVRLWIPVRNKMRNVNTVLKYSQFEIHFRDSSFLNFLEI